MPPQRVTLNGRQLAALGLAVGLIAVQAVVVLTDGPLWLQAILAGLLGLTLVLCAFVVVIPLAREKYR